MKKLAILVGAIALSGTTLAQRPEGSNPFSLEGGLSLNATENTFSAPTIKLRYFATDNIAGRLGLSYNSSKDIYNFYGFDANFDQTADSLGTVTAKSSMTWVSIGGSYHFSQLEKLSPYVALDLMYGMGSYNESWSNADGNDPFDQTDGGSYVDGLSAEVNTKNSGIGFGLSAGFDYYFAQNVFIGAELGLMYNSVNDKGGTVSSTFGNTTENADILTSGKSSSMGNSATAAIRLGWRF
jgi:outer membrane protein W